MTRHKFQALRDRYLTEPAEQALVAEMSRASRLITALARLRDDSTCGPEGAGAAADGDVPPDQPQIAEEDSLFLATLKDGVEELGGRLEVVAVFPGQRVTLTE